jgi:hypothetical protein
MQENPTNIIKPPTEIRDIIKKTAWYVSKKGLEFEYKIKENELNSSKFSFLNSNDPYHDYYIHYRTNLLAKNLDTTPSNIPAGLQPIVPEYYNEGLNYSNYILSLADIDSSLISSLYFCGAKNHKFNSFIQMSCNFYSSLSHPELLKQSKKSTLLYLLSLSRRDYMDNRTKLDQNGGKLDLSNLNIIGYVDSHDFDLIKSINALMKNDLLGANSEERSKIYNRL